MGAGEIKQVLFHFFFLPGASWQTPVFILQDNDLKFEFQR